MPVVEFWYLPLVYFNAHIYIWIVKVLIISPGQKCLPEYRKNVNLSFPVSFWSLLINGCNSLFYKGTLSEEGLLVYLRVLQTLLSQLPVSPANTSCQDSASDSEDESGETDTQTSAPVSSRVLRVRAQLHLTSEVRSLCPSLFLII